MAFIGRELTPVSSMFRTWSGTRMSDRAEPPHQEITSRSRPGRRTWDFWLQQIVRRQGADVCLWHWSTSASSIRHHNGSAHFGETTQIDEPGRNLGSPLVLAVGNPSTNAFVFPNGEEPIGIMQFVVPGFKNLILRCLFPARAHPSTHGRFWFCGTWAVVSLLKQCSLSRKELICASMQGSDRNSTECIDSSSWPFSRSSRVLAPARITFGASGIRARLWDAIGESPPKWILMSFREFPRRWRGRSDATVAKIRSSQLMSNFNLQCKPGQYKSVSIWFVLFWLAKWH
jgi:hypothetical protein